MARSTPPPTPHEGNHQQKDDSGNRHPERLHGHQCHSHWMKGLFEVGHGIDRSAPQARRRGSPTFPSAIIFEHVPELALAVGAGGADILLHVRFRNVLEGIGICFIFILPETELRQSESCSTEGDGEPLPPPQQ